MPVVAVIGAQWGDEGKGKIVDMLAEKADVVIRFSGGDNAGHTVINPHGEYALHLVPSGIFSRRAACIMGNGMVINPAVLIAEMALLQQHGIDLSRLYISDRANLIMPYHTLLDGLEEEARGGNAIGTTRKGIGPAFADKAARLGIRAGDLLDKEGFRHRLATVLEQKNAVLTRVYGQQALSLDEVFAQYCEYGEGLRQHICDTTLIVAEALERGETVMLEGAQGTLLDPDFGTYPFATSSSPLVSGGLLGAGIGPTNVSDVLGVYKAYCTRIGEGPMPTELTDETGHLIRERAHEYGTTTGRPRRCGWFDAVAARFSCRVNGFTGMAVTRLDILDGFSSLKICNGYTLDGVETDQFPSRIGDLARCQPVYEELPGWRSPTGAARKYGDLPPEARRYLERLEELVRCPVRVISVGSSREQTVQKLPIV